jgi:DNA repair exonuclease SbcCD nuclease subunit
MIKLTNRQINIIFVSDTHLGFDYPMRPRVVKRRRGEDFFKNFHTVLSYAKEERCDLVIHGGDLFYRSKVPEALVDRVYRILSDFADFGIPVYIVPGNHERSRLPTSLFLNHPLIHIFNKPKLFSKWIKGAKVIICGFPFIGGDLDRSLTQILDHTGWNQTVASIKILVLHQAIEGATVGPGNFTFRKGPDVLSPFALPEDADVILCGHIHRKQILTKWIEDSKKGIPIIFSGSIERTSFAEKDEAKGFYHLIFSVETTGEWSLQHTRFIALPTRPMEDIYLNFSISPRIFRRE